MVSAPAFQAGDASHRGFESLLPLHFSRFGRVAQRLAQRAYIPQVVGSNPTPPTILESADAFCLQLISMELTGDQSGNTNRTLPFMSSENASLAFWPLGPRILAISWDASSIILT